MTFLPEFGADKGLSDRLQKVADYLVRKIYIANYREIMWD